MTSNQNSMDQASIIKVLKNSSNISHSSNSLERTSNKPSDRGRVNPSIPPRIGNERMTNKPSDRGRVNPSIPRIDNEG